MSESPFFKECSVYLSDYIFIDSNFTIRDTDTRVPFITRLSKVKLVTSLANVCEIKGVKKCERLSTQSHEYALYRFDIVGGKYLIIALSTRKQSGIMDNEIKTKQLEGGFKSHLIMGYREGDDIMKNLAIDIAHDMPTLSHPYRFQRYVYQSPFIFLTKEG